MEARVKVEDLARWFGISEGAVRALSRRGLVVKASRGEFKSEESIRTYCTHLREAVAAHGRPAATGSGRDRARLAAAQADAIELKNARARGALVDAEAVAREWEGVCRTIRAGVLRVPRRAAARLPHLTPQDVRAIDCEVRAVLAELVRDATKMA